MSELKAMIETLPALMGSDDVRLSMLASGMHESEWNGLQHIRKMVDRQCKRLAAL